MLYSCFNEKLRLYEVFEDGRGHPVNGDLPVPNLPPPVNNIGVPAIDAGRALPKDAKRVGTSWHARGLVVQCNNLPVPGIGAEGDFPSAGQWILAIGLASVVVWGTLKVAESPYFKGAR